MRHQVIDDIVDTHMPPKSYADQWDTEGLEVQVRANLQLDVPVKDWAEEDGVEIFYFSSFDETWKVDAEGDVGAYWGLWDKDGNLKYV